MKNKIKLTIIILNHNTKQLTLDCLDSLEKCKNEIPFEVIVSDNGSTDGSVDAIKKRHKWAKIIKGPNISFSNGNNRAKKYTNGEYVLLLNSDTIVYKNTLKKCVEYMEKHKDVGALTCKLVLEDGTLDKDVRRRFPTPWLSFQRLFLGNGKLYWYEDYGENKIHEVETIQGAFFLTKRSILDEVGWLDEGFIFDGEDLDLSFQIHKRGYKIIYYPEVKTLHLKGATKGKIKETSKNVDLNLKLNRVMQGVNSMEYFYRKNLWSRYPVIFNLFVLLGIKILKLIRLVKFKISN